MIKKVLVLCAAMLFSSTSIAEWGYSIPLENKLEGYTRYFAMYFEGEQHISVECRKLDDNKGAEYYVAVETHSKGSFTPNTDINISIKVDNMDTITLPGGVWNNSTSGAYVTRMLDWQRGTSDPAAQLQRHANHSSAFDLIVESMMRGNNVLFAVNGVDLRSATYSENLNGAFDSILYIMAQCGHYKVPEWSAIRSRINGTAL